MRDALFVADSVGVSFGRHEVLKAATFWVRRGRITVLLGRNGSGKSTLIRASLGLGKMDYGSVRFGVRAFLRPRLAEFARSGLYFLPDGGSLARGFTLRWHLQALAREFPGGNGFDVAVGLGMEPFLDHTPFEMSGGEERKAEIALAIARRPTCLLADEPFNGIAPRDQERVGDALLGLAASGSAVLVTGHEVQALLDVADEVIWLTAGTTHGLGSAAEAGAHYQFRREYLGPGANDPPAQGHP